MAIVPLDKVTIYGSSRQKETALDGLQQLGCVHLIDLEKSVWQPTESISQEARSALCELESCPILRKQVAADDQYNFDQLVAEVLSIKKSREKLIAERDHLEKSIGDLEPWGNFSLPSGQTFGFQFWFYVVALHELPELSDELTWHVASKDSQSAYVVILLPDEPQDVPGTLVELDPRPLSKLRHRLRAVREELEDLHWRRATLTRWIRMLKRNLDEADDKAALAAAASGTLDDDQVFAVQGWVPRMAAEDVKRFAENHELAFTIGAPAEDDAPPTLLTNPERIAGAENCVTFYITPNYRAWDPTGVVFFSLSLFFAMIVSDAGYGLVMLSIVIAFWRRLSQSRSGTRLRNLMLGISTATIVYGVLLGSYFGIDPPSSSMLDSLQIKIKGQGMMNDRTTMMFLSVAIGVIHLAMANLISAWQTRQTSRCLGHCGWAGIIVGAFLIGSGAFLEQSSVTDIGWALVTVGAFAVLFFSSDVPLWTWNPRIHLRRALDGVMQVSNVSKAFGDTLSYLRLFALGLASSQLALTFNSMASDAMKVGGIGMLLAIVILTFGHGINFLLGIMGGVVHGLRLNCIEFFNWSLTSEGSPFEPFKKKVEA